MVDDPIKKGPVRHGKRLAATWAKEPHSFPILEDRDFRITFGLRLY